MAIILKNPIETPEGIELTNAYVNIGKFYLDKITRVLQIEALVYANEEKRQTKKKNILLPQFGTIQIVLGEDVDLNVSFYELAYTGLKNHLTKEGIEFTDSLK